MFTCREVEKLLDIYLDGELDTDRCREVFTHLRQCPSCGKLLSERVKETERILISFPAPELAPGFTEKVINSIANQADQHRFSIWPICLTGKQWLGTVLTGLLLVATLTGIYSHPLSISRPEIIKQAIPLKTAGGTVDNRAAGSAPRNNNYSSAVSTDKAEIKTPAPQRLKNEGINNTYTAPGTATGENRKEEETSLQVRSLLSEEVQGAADSKTNLKAMIPSGYVVFTPTYLPPGYIQEKVTVISEDYDNLQQYQKPIAILFANPINGSEIKLTIIPEGLYYGSHDSNEPAGIKALSVHDGQPPENNTSITWYAEKEGIHFYLILSGDLPPQELKRIADSIR